MKKNVCHITSAHQSNDVRIFLKECVSLSCAAYNVTLVAANAKSETVNNIRIIGVDSPNSSRITRWSKTVWRVYKESKKLNSDVYHLHDPEMLIVALLLKKKYNRVLFDAHEDLPKQILDKYYINKRLRKLIAGIVRKLEKAICKRLDGIVAATNNIGEKFKSINKNTVVINNFPLQNELAPEQSNWNEKENSACFIGGMSEIRGITQLVEAAGLIGSYQINLAGSIAPESYKLKLMGMDSWSKVNWHGQLSRSDAKELMLKSKAGLVTFLPAANHMEAQPNKMFEYMSSGIPVIASHFPVWKEIIEKNKCGVCVDPSNAKDIAEAIKLIMENKELASQMGANGREAVMLTYNWNAEEKKLIHFYKSLFSNE